MSSHASADDPAESVAPIIHDQFRLMEGRLAGPVIPRRPGQIRPESPQLPQVRTTDSRALFPLGLDRIGVRYPPAVDKPNLSKSITLLKGSAIQL